MDPITQQVVLATAGAAGGETYWIATLGGTSSDNGEAVAVDSSGNVYVAGYGDSATTSYNDGFVVKYDSSGSLQWQRYLGGGFETNTIFESIALDSSNNVYVAGYTNQQGAGSWDVLVAKYNSSGTIQWQRTLGGTSIDQSFGGIAVDSSGNAYVIGYTMSTGAGDRDFLIVKYNTSGTIQWQRTLGDSFLQVGNAVAVDSSGNVYVTGSNAIGNFPSYQLRVLVAKYNTSGTIQWQKVLYGSSDEAGKGIALDSSGNIYIAGFSKSFGAGEDLVVAKYNSSGTVQWQRKLSGSSNESGTAISVDSSGNVYVTGLTQSTGAGSYDILIAKYNTSGTIQWQRTLGGSSFSEGDGITVDNSGNVYVAGATNSTGAGSSDFIIAKLPDDGSLTGTYGSLTYASSSLTDAATTLTEGTSSLTSSSSSLTDSSSTLTDAASSLTSSTTDL